MRIAVDVTPCISAMGSACLPLRACLLTTAPDRIDRLRSPDYPRDRPRSTAGFFAADPGAAGSIAASRVRSTDIAGEFGGRQQGRQEGRQEGRQVG